MPDEENFIAAPLFAPWLKDKTDQTKWNTFTDKFRILPAEDGAKKTDAPSPARGWAKGEPFRSADWDAYLGYSLAEKLAALEGDLSAISEAASRPALYLPILEGALYPTPTLDNFFLTSAKAYALRAQTHLEGKHPEAALRDIQMVLRLCDYELKDQTIIAWLVGMTSISAVQEPIATALSTQQWAEADIAALQSQLEAIHPIREAYSSFQKERAFILTVLESDISGLTTGPPVNTTAKETAHQDNWRRYPTLRRLLIDSIFRKTLIFKNKLHYAKGWERHIPACMDGEKSIHRKEVDRFQAAIKEEEADTHATRLLAPSLIALKAYTGAFPRLGEFQTLRDQAVVACALERYRLRHGAYPETLSALVPEFCAELPHDVMTGEPLRYRVGKPAENYYYTLYSVGWNGTDDGGKLAFKKGGASESKEGDWVWLMPPAHRNTTP